MTDHTALIEALERAEGPSRVLDEEIGMMSGWAYKKLSNSPFCRWHDPSGQSHSGIPCFTASIDAALTLVPEGWRIYTADFSVLGRARWGLSGPKTQWATDENGEKCAGDDWYQSAIAKTPALALCATALRAKGAQS